MTPALAAARTADRGPSDHPPTRLSEVVGHLMQRQQLERQLLQGALAHAYWISGPARVGKTTLALALASELLQAEGWPGGLEAHPDFWLDDQHDSLGVDRVRGPEGELGPSLQHFLSLSAYASGPKVAVLANADRLTLPAANSLLRLLEEPPAESILILTTSRPDSEHLPGTLRSRCQQLGLGPVAAPLIATWLAALGRPELECETAAAISEGRPGLALELASDPELASRTQGLLDSFLGCSNLGPAGWLDLSRELAERGRERELAWAALRTWAAFLRTCCALAAGSEPPPGPPAFRAGGEAWARALGLPESLRRYDLAVEGLSRLAEGATARLVLDRLLLLTFGAIASQPAAAAGRVRP
ncbi:MAG: hypothetical protein ACP5PW_08250 [Candidatus Dormibacteria bacterium]